MVTFHLVDAVVFMFVKYQYLNTMMLKQNNCLNCSVTKNVVQLFSTYVVGIRDTVRVKKPFHKPFHTAVFNHRRYCMVQTVV